MQDMADIAIIGGGAAGLAAAIFAAEGAGAPCRIVVLDGAKSLGAKILVSGGGRCNVTHERVVPADFNGSQPIIRNILAAFDAAATVRWFASMGVDLKREETGKLFPVANTAKVVVAALLDRCRKLGVELSTGCRVTAIEPPSDSLPFRISHEKGTLLAKRVIMSTGGRSLPRSGSDGAGWEIVRTLGHEVTPTFAALAPLVLDISMFHALVSGIGMDVELTTTVGAKRIDRRRGNLLWTHFGISGPVVMDASRHWIIGSELGQRAELLCNLLPDENQESIEKWLVGLTSTRPKLSIANAIGGRLPERIATALLSYLKVNPAITCSQLPRDTRKIVMQGLTALPLPALHHRGWNYAEVTAGGVPLSEINFRTMESRKVPGLYLAGEILDCDGRIGGFNFQWAWATGYLAGRAARLVAASA
jgi:predicted Rossmann fold flavoprotein